MATEELKKKLEGKVRLTLRFINEVLYPRKDTNKSLLDEHKTVLINYQKSGDINILRELRVIESKPVPEGAATDFTSGTSLPIDQQYTSLGELIMEIEDLVFGIEGGES